MTNKEMADQVIRGKKSFVQVASEKQATAVRVAGHRLGAVLTALRVKGGWRLIKSAAKVTHRRKPRPGRSGRAPQRG